MLCELEDKILKLLYYSFKDRALVGSYLGELEDIKEFERCLNDKPLILLEFNGESYINVSTKELNYKLYLINKTSNKSSFYRQDCKFMLYKISEELDGVLFSTHLMNDKAVSIKGLVKFFEGISEYGYLSVYAKEFSLMVQKDLPNISDISEEYYD